MNMKRLLKSRIISGTSGYSHSEENRTCKVMDIIARRKIIRLLVKEILVGADTITIRHSIPLGNSSPHPPDSTPPALPGRGFSDCVRGVPVG
jgi:hypothetical protein